MSTTVINIRTQTAIKKSAKQVAEQFGLSLSSLINSFLKQLIKTKKITFSLSEEPTPYLIKILKEAEKDKKAGYVSPGFNNVEEAMKWLDNPKSRYKNGHRV